MQGRPSVRAWEIALAANVAILIVAGIDLCTGSIPPFWDTVSYVDMARNGVVGNDHLIAPYAYRLGMPALVRLVTRMSSLDAVAAFAWVGRFMAAALLLASFLLARCFLDTPGKALIPVAFVGLSAMHVKFPLFFTTMVDVAAYPLMVLAVWAFVRRRLWLSLLISMVGVLFKEFMVIPLVLGIGHLASAARRDRSWRNVGALAAASSLALGVVLLPRLGLPLTSNQQTIDPLHNLASLKRLALDPLDGPRDLNIALSVIGYWLPSLLLLTGERWRQARPRLAPLETFITGFLALNFLLVMYGGTNVLIFVSYSVPIQIMVLAALVQTNPHPAEWFLALLCAFLFNRAAWAIPSPEQNVDAYLDFYGGWDSRINVSTLSRAVEMGWYFLAMRTLRAALARRSRARVEPLAER